MPDSPDLDKLQQQIFDLVERSQDAVVGAGRAFTDSVSNVVPGDTTAVEDLIDRAFELTEKVLQSQREFAKNVVRAAANQVPGTEGAGADDATGDGTGDDAG